MDVAAPVAAEEERSGGNSTAGLDVEAPESAQADNRVAGAPAPQRGALARFLPAGTVRRYRALQHWSHSQVALLLGSLFSVALAVAALVSLIVVGFAGAGTHNIPALYGPAPVDTANQNLGPQPPVDPQSIFTPPAPLLTQPPGLNSSLNQSLSMTVLQLPDLPAGYTLLNSGTTGADAVAGLLASYHAIYQRPIDETTVGEGGVAILSVLGLYRDVGSASLHFLDVTPDRLGVEAGLPNLSADLVPARTVADESRVIHLAGKSAGVDVGAYLVQFRRGTTDAIVGVAATLGAESLEQALALADAQDGRIVAASLPDIKP